MSELIIRLIAKDDVFACLSIYNYEVEYGVATLDLEPRTLEEWHEWYNAHSDEHHPIIVGTIDDVVVGYASLSPYRLKDAFKSTVELSIYILQDYRGQVDLPLKLVLNMENIRIPKLTHYWYNNRY